jgi:uncharacterized membrane protein
MKMSRPVKIVLLLATLWPLLYMFIFFGVFVSMFFLMARAQGGPHTAAGNEPPVWFFSLFALHLLTMLWSMALTAIYIVNVFKNERVEKDKKALWAVVIFFGNVIAMPVYWYLYIWREPGAEVRDEG